MEWIKDLINLIKNGKVTSDTIEDIVIKHHKYSLGGRDRGESKGIVWEKYNKLTTQTIDIK